MFRKPVAWLILLLFILSTLFPIILGVEISSNKIIYVDDDGTADYTRIQDAIDNASDGDTVFVYSGMYYEQIIVDKSITLQGEDWNSTIIDGSGRKNVLITADRVNITGFLVISSGDYYHGAIEIRSSYSNVYNNKFTKSFEDAIEVEENTTDTIIKDNYIYENGKGVGIYAVDTVKNTIKHNYIINNDGIGLWLGRTSGNIIKENVFINNSLAIQLSGRSNNNSIEKNIIESSYGSGIFFHYHSNNNIVTDNNLKNSGPYSILISESSNLLIDANILNGANEGITLFASSYNIITNNTIHHTKEFSFALAVDSDYNTVAWNTIADNEMNGLILHDASDNTIIENIIADNQEHGLYLERYSDNNIISKNLIERNNGYGLYLDNSSNNTITFNNLIFNKRNANFQNSQNNWDRNYWNRPRIFPYIIIGKVDSKIKLEFDWFPRWFPYENLGVENK